MASAPSGTRRGNVENRSSNPRPMALHTAPLSSKQPWRVHASGPPLLSSRTPSTFTSHPEAYLRDKPNGNKL